MKRRTIQRRNLLGGGLGLVGLAGLGGSRLAQASAGSARRLIYVIASGGWDPTWVFDPKPDSNDVHTAAGDWSSYGNLDLWQTSETPAVHSFFEEWNSIAAVVNGFGVESLVHEECMKRVLTGRSGEDVPDIGSLTAAELGAERPLPYLVQSSSARLAGYEAQAGMLGFSNQLSTLTVPLQGYPTNTGPAYRPSEAVDTAVHQYLQDEAKRRQSGPWGTIDAKRWEDYVESLDRGVHIRSEAATGFLADPQLVYSEDPWTHAVRALEEEFSQAVFAEDAGYWDTHSYNDEQGALYEALFSNLADLMTMLHDADLLRDTLVVVTSEMGRSPLLNAEAGKDHWPFTSALLLGECVSSALVQGTNDDLRPHAVDRGNGSPSVMGRELVSADLLATIGTLLGLPVNQLYPDAEVIDAVVG